MATGARKRAGTVRRPQGTTLLVSTRKGLWTLASDAARRTWKLAGPQFLGNIVHHAVQDPRDGWTRLIAARTGHLGPTVFRSTDRGKTWKEAARPPAFKPGGTRSVDHTFWLTPGAASEPGVWYAGTSPQGLFRSTDGGATWSGIDGFNEHSRRKDWCGGDKDGTPDGPKLHSILVDPRDAKHLYIGMSGGGIFESTNAGGDWHPLNAGCAPISCRIPIPSMGMTRIACGCIRWHPTASITRIIAASIVWTGRPRAGPRSARRCRSQWARSACRWSCIRAIRKRFGCSRWTGRASGRACRPGASRQPIAR